MVHRCLLSYLKNAVTEIGFFADECVHVSCQLILSTAVQHNVCQANRRLLVSHSTVAQGGMVVQQVQHWTCEFAINRSWVQILLEATLHNNLGQVVHTYVPLSPSSITWYLPKSSDALCGWEGNRIKVMAAYCQVNCGLTACTPGLAPGPMLDIKYEKPLPIPFYYYHYHLRSLYRTTCVSRNPQV